jgi:2-(3-amino-3-carboxypropyl)histidine synthase
MRYDFETERVIHEIKSMKAKRVGLQFPEGLKHHAVELAAEIESKTNAEVVILTDPSYGACDRKEEQARKLKLDLLVHYGHTEF